MSDSGEGLPDVRGLSDLTEALGTQGISSGEGPTVVIVGLGYVGLPLAVALARSGARVIGLDVDAGVVESIRQGRSHVGDVRDADLAPLVEGERPALRTTTDADAIAAADAVVICVPTPLRKTKDPDISHVVAASENVASRARAGQLVVLESTTYPGTTLDLLVPLLEKRGLVPGRDVAVAFSPERVDPGNPDYDLTNTPKIVGGVTGACTRAAAALYGRCCERVVTVGSPTTAEMVKLLENTFRSVNIALVNEFALICHRLGIDVWEVIDAASTKPFGFMPFRPGPGLGGHCIPVDPHYLAWKLRSLNFTARFIELADAINSRMPEHVVSVTADALNDAGLPLRDSRILVLGVAYKPGVADVRESPAIPILAALREKGARVDYHDPLVRAVDVAGERLTSIEDVDAALSDADCTLIVTDHASYDWRRVVELSRQVVDTRNATGALLREEPRFASTVRRI